MLHLVIGGSASGKSEYAESQAVEYAQPQVAGPDSKPTAAGSRLYYIAAMKPYGEEAQKRIERHRLLRQGKGFETIEWYTDLAALCAEKPELAGQTVLVECLSNLTANEIFDPEGAGPAGAEEAIMSGLRELAALAEKLIVVSADVFGEGPGGRNDTEPGDMTDVYIRILGRINTRLARMADQVTEVVYSIPIPQK